MEEDRAISKTYENKYKEKDYLKDYTTTDTFAELNAESACFNVHLNTNENETTTGSYILITTDNNQQYHHSTAPLHPFCWDDDDGGKQLSISVFKKGGSEKMSAWGDLKEFLP